MRLAMVVVVVVVVVVFGVVVVRHGHQHGNRGHLNPCSCYRVKPPPYTAPNRHEVRMKIGELSTASSTPIETIRYYERQGLLPPPARTQGNFRDYDKPHQERLQFIRHCRSLDMSLDEVRVLLRFKDEPGADCGDVNELIDEHIGHVSRRIRELRALEKQLKELRQRCGQSRGTDQCGILAGLSQAALEPSAATDRKHLRSVHQH